MDSARLTIRVQPNASRQRIVGMMNGAVKVAVFAPPEKGKANQAVEKLLASEFGLPKRAVRVVSGGSSRRKTVTLEGIAQAQVDKWLKNLKSQNEGTE